MMADALQNAARFEATDQATDPRVLRSRQMLMDALTELLAKKEFDDISVQEIADQASLNRATFYLHYPDKAALLQAVSAARFERLIARRGLVFSDCDGALRAIALGVCDYLSESPGCPGDLAKLPLEGSIIPVVTDIFRKGGESHEVRPGTDRALLATTAAWAVFGAARQWYQTVDRIPAEEMAEKIEAMVKPIFFSAGV